MTPQGGTEPVSPETEQRLRAHVAAILAGAGVQPAVHDDLAEELYGHLLERSRTHVEAGMPEAEAAARAIADFGSADGLAREFGRTYHSRVWASTIGVLLPAVAVRDERPGIVRWLRLTLGLAILVTVVGLLVVLPQATPLRALGTLAVEVIGLVVLRLAYRALAYGQGWALWYAIAIAVELVVLGVWSVVAPAVPGSIIVPLGAILAIGVLLGVHASWARLQTFVAGSRPIGRGLGLVLAGSIFLPALVPPALAALPDPTQAGAADLALRVSMTCDRGDVPLAEASSAINVQRITLVAEMTWRRSDFLPGGLTGLLQSSDYGDSAGFRLIDEAAQGSILPAWLLASNDVPVVDVETGETAGWFGAGSPSTTLLPQTIGSFTIGIEQSAIRAGHPIRATWLLTPTSDADAAWPQIEVAYAHLDRFLLIGTVRCGQTVIGHEASLGVPVSPLTQLALFGLPLPEDTTLRLPNTGPPP